MVDDPYASIAQFWGEDLDRNLARRIVAAPEEHLDAFEDFLFDRQSGLSVTSLDVGKLRPVLTHSLVDRLSATSQLALATEGAGILLYAHELILDDPIGYLASDSPQERALAAETLLTLRPLFEDGSIQFVPVSSWKRHPLMLGRRKACVEAIIAAANAGRLSIPELPHDLEVDRVFAPRSDEESLGVLMASEVAADVAAYVAHLEHWGTNAHPLFRSRVEAQGLAAALSGADRHPPHALRQLASVRLPRLASHAPELVQIRRNEDSFDEWRGLILQAVSGVEVTESEDGVLPSATATLQFADELERATDILRRRVLKSRIMPSLVGGLQNFGISAVASLGGLFVGGNFGSAVAGGAITHALSTGLRVKQAGDARRRDERLLHLAVSVTSELRSEHPGPSPGR